MYTVQSHTSIAASEAYAASVLSVKMFDFSLLLSPTCLILCFGGVLPFLGTFSYSFVVSYMNQKNFAKFPQLMHVQTTFVYSLLGFETPATERCFKLMVNVGCALGLLEACVRR